MTLYYYKMCKKNRDYLLNAFEFKIILKQKCYNRNEVHI
jgi:hypothetical protein